MTPTNDLWLLHICAFAGWMVPLLYEAKYNHIPNDHIDKPPMNIVGHSGDRENILPVARSR